jgi:hypothetical protein
MWHLWASINIPCGGTITGDIYLSVIKDNFVPFLHGYGTGMEDNWFQQDGASPHTARLYYFLDKIFDSRVLSNHYPDVYRKGLLWSPISPYLKPCGFYL